MCSLFFFSSRRRHTRSLCDWSSDVCSSDLVLARVAAAGPAAWLIQGVWPRDAYGVFAAEDKAGKTWAILDLACSVATGVPWLGHFACPPTGPVLVFLGEGGERAMMRRLEAICAYKHLDLQELATRRRLRLCF